MNVHTTKVRSVKCNSCCLPSFFFSAFNMYYGINNKPGNKWVKLLMLCIFCRQQRETNLVKAFLFYAHFHNATLNIIVQSGRVLRAWTNNFVTKDFLRSFFFVVIIRTYTFKYESHKRLYIYTGSSLWFQKLPSLYERAPALPMELSWWK